MSLIRPIIPAIVLALTAACAPRNDSQPPVCPQPTTLTGADVQTHAKQSAAQKEEVARLAQERDSARQWASDEARRQAEGLRHRQLRRDLQMAEWHKLDEVDEQIRELRHRLDQWTLPDRRGGILALHDAEADRLRIDGEIRQIHVEPDRTLPDLRAQIDRDLESTKEELRDTLHRRKRD